MAGVRETRALPARETDGVGGYRYVFSNGVSFAGATA